MEKGSICAMLHHVIANVVLMFMRNRAMVEECETETTRWNNVRPNKELGRR